MRRDAVSTVICSINRFDGLFRVNTPVYVITEQPQSYYRYLPNSFRLLTSEKLYREWSYTDRYCCCLNVFHTTLTDIRLLTRSEETICCGEPSHSDSSVYLRDISQIRECRGEQPTFFFLLWLLLICAWPCYVVRRIFCPKHKCLEVYGSFGSELVRLREQDRFAAQVDLSIAISNSKLIGRV